MISLQDYAGYSGSLSHGTPYLGYVLRNKLTAPIGVI